MCLCVAVWAVVSCVCLCVAVCNCVWLCGLVCGLCVSVCGRVVCGCVVVWLCVDGSISLAIWDGDPTVAVVANVRLETSI